MNQPVSSFVSSFLRSAGHLSCRIQGTEMQPYKSWQKCRQMHVGCIRTNIQNVMSKFSVCWIKTDQKQKLKLAGCWLSDLAPEDPASAMSNIFWCSMQEFSPDIYWQKKNWRRSPEGICKIERSSQVSIAFFRVFPIAMSTSAGRTRRRATDRRSSLEWNLYHAVLSYLGRSAVAAVVAGCNGDLPRNMGESCGMSLQKLVIEFDLPGLSWKKWCSNGIWSGFTKKYGCLYL